MSRHWEVDALRGSFLVLMTVTHLPTLWAGPLGQPLGFVSAAEGFVLLSGWMAGLVYARRLQQQGPQAMALGMGQRALQVYVAHVALLIGLFLLLVPLAVWRNEGAILGLAHLFIRDPGLALGAGLALLYRPALLDILPMYVLFLLASPALLLWAQRPGGPGWGGIVALSVGLWALAQLGLGAALHRVFLAWTGLPLRDMGAFDLFAWQLLWVVGLWLGQAAASPQPPHWRFPRGVVMAAAALALVTLLWRHAVGQVPWPGLEPINQAFDKWALGPVRLLNLLALGVLLLHFSPWIRRRLRVRRPWARAVVAPALGALALLGRHSLTVFVAHLVIVLLALAWLGAASPARGWVADTALLAATLVALWVVARRADARAARGRHPPGEARAGVGTPTPAVLRAGPDADTARRA